MQAVLVVIGHRAKRSVKVQDILADYGEVIKTRLGLNQTMGQEKEACGFIFMELCASPEKCRNLVNELNQIPDVKAEYMNVELESGSCQANGDDQRFTVGMPYVGTLA